MKKKYFLFIFISLTIIFIASSQVNADTGRITYTNHYEDRGQINDGLYWKHTTTATARTSGQGFFVGSTTAVQYSQIPPFVYHSYKAESWVKQLKENTSWQAHYHYSVSGWSN